MSDLDIEVTSDIATTTEPMFKMIWKAGSQYPGQIEHTVYTQSQLPVHNMDEVLGPDRVFVEATPGSNLWHLCVDGSLVDPSHTLWNATPVCWNWEINDIEYAFPLPITWDDIRFQRNNFLASSDAMFNIDTVEPLKQQWIDHRQLLRDLPERELAAGRTPETVFWDDYLPPYPLSARGGIPAEDAMKCVWYTATAPVVKATPVAEDIVVETTEE